MNFPTGFASLTAALYVAIRRATSSSSINKVRDKTPKPLQPAISWDSGPLAAHPMGASGFWSGLGTTGRDGTLKYFPSQEKVSLVQAPTTTSNASSHIARV